MAEELDEDQIEAMLDDLKRKLDRLRVLYEQFFLGTEKTPPHQLRRDVVREMHRLTQVRIKRAALKFRFSSLQQRFNAHKAYWARSEREIEMGTYKRQTFRARQRQRDPERADVLESTDWLAINAVRDAQGAEAAAEAKRERIAAREREQREQRAARARQQREEDAAAAEFLRELGGDAASAPAPAGASGKRSAAEIRGAAADDVKAKAARLRALKQRMKGGSGASAPADPDRALYDRLVAAKKKLNQSTDSMSYERVRQGLEAQRKKYGERSVDFDVVVKDGKAFLKPTTR